MVGPTTFPHIAVSGQCPSSRQCAGVKAAKGRGVKFGRKPKLSPQQITHARELIDKGEARHHVADLLNVDRTTLYRALTG